MKIEYFEFGCICCMSCGHKPDDGWDVDPEGFREVEEAQWLCTECILDYQTRGLL